MSLDELCSRLDVILLETGEKKVEDPNAKDKPKEDPFAVNKKLIADEIRQIKKLINERDKLVSENPSSTQAVALSSDIRHLLTDTEKHVDKLEQGHKAAVEKYAKKKAKKPGDPNLQLEEQFEIRDQVIECARANLSECRNLERKRLGGPAYIPGKNASAPATIPNVDDPRFQALIQRDDEINKVLDSIGGKVHILHGMAVEMNETVKVQSDMIDRVEANVDDLNAQLVTVNKKLKDILTKLRSPDRFIIDFILICLLLGIGGLIYKVVKDRT